MIVDHGLSDTQRKLLGVGMVYFGSAFYNLCYCIFYIVMNKFAEYESLPTNYTSAVYIGAACCYFVLGSVAMSATRKKPSITPMNIDYRTTILSFKVIVGIIFLTCWDLNGLNSGSDFGGLITHRGLLVICPKEVFVTATSLLLFFHISVLYVYFLQRGLESKLMSALRAQHVNHFYRRPVRSVPAGVRINNNICRIPVVVRQ